MNTVPEGSSAMTTLLQQRGARDPCAARRRRRRQRVRRGCVSAASRARAARRARRAMAASVRSTSAMRMSPMCPMRNADASYFPSPRRGENAARLDAVADRFAARCHAGTAIAVSVGANVAERRALQLEPESRAPRCARAPPSPHAARYTCVESLLVHQSQRFGDLQHDVHRRGARRLGPRAWTTGADVGEVPVVARQPRAGAARPCAFAERRRTRAPDSTSGISATRSPRQSTPHASNANGMPPIEDTPSTSTSASCARATRAHGARRRCERRWTCRSSVTATARAAGCSRRARSDFARVDSRVPVRRRPDARRHRTTPRARAHISPNLPLQHTAISSPGEKRLQIAASMRAATGGVHGQDRLRRAEHRAQQLEHRGEFARELRRPVMDHRPGAGAQHALGNARRARASSAAAARAAATLTRSLPSCASASSISALNNWPRIDLGDPRVVSRSISCVDEREHFLGALRAAPRPRRRRRRRRCRRASPPCRRS